MSLLGIWNDSTFNYRRRVLRVVVVNLSPKVQLVSQISAKTFMCAELH